jgi:hypothetical protein
MIEDVLKLCRNALKYILDSQSSEMKPGINKFLASILFILLLIPMSVAEEPDFLLASETYPEKIVKTLQGIIFDSDYDNGSLQDVIESGENIFNCTIYTDQGESGSSKYWFRFKMTGVAGRIITLNIDHSQNPLPVIRVNDGGWRRMTDTEAPSSSQLVLFFAANEDHAEVAFFFPSGYDETYRQVGDLVRRCDMASTESIGLSYMGRSMWMATITDSHVTDTYKHRIWIHSRAHAGEATGTHVMLGLLNLVTSNSPAGRYMRRHFIFNIVPLLNVDGVYLGHTRWDSQGIDPERQWGNPSRIPETANLRAKVDEFMDGTHPIEVALNLHSSVNDFEDTFFFKHVQPSVTAAFEAIEQRYIDALDHATPLFDNLNPQTSQLHAYYFIESYFWNNWGESVMAMTHEGHFFHRLPDNLWITNEDYRDLGAAMAMALIEYFNLPPIGEESPPTSWMIY